jgi:hypothetical protein
MKSGLLLNGIIGFTELLMRFNLNQLEYIMTVNESVDSLMVVNDVLDFN